MPVGELGRQNCILGFNFTVVICLISPKHRDLWSRATILEWIHLCDTGSSHRSRWHLEKDTDWFRPACFLHFSICFSETRWRQLQSASCALPTITCSEEKLLIIEHLSKSLLMEQCVSKLGNICSIPSFLIFCWRIFCPDWERNQRLDLPRGAKITATSQAQTK